MNAIIIKKQKTTANDYFDVKIQWQNKKKTFDKDCCDRSFFKKNKNWIRVKENHAEICQNSKFQLVKILAATSISLCYQFLCKIFFVVVPSFRLFIRFCFLFIFRSSPIGIKPKSTKEILIRKEKNFIAFELNNDRIRQCLKW